MLLISEEDALKIRANMDILERVKATVKCWEDIMSYADEQPVTKKSPDRTQVKEMLGDFIACLAGTPINSGQGDQEIAPGAKRDRWITILPTGLLLLSFRLKGFPEKLYPICTGMKDTESNRGKLRLLREEILEDISLGLFDQTLERYKAKIKSYDPKNIKDKWIVRCSQTGRLRIRFSLKGYKNPFNIPTKLEDCESNRAALRPIRDEILEDLSSDKFDQTLERYKAKIIGHKKKEDKWIVFHPKTGLLTIRFNPPGLKNQVVLYSGLEDSQSNRQKLRSLRDEIADDIFSGLYDSTLERYKEKMERIKHTQGKSRLPSIEELSVA